MTLKALLIESYIYPKDSTTHAVFEEREGQIINNNITKNYMSYVEDTLAPALKIAVSKIDELTRVKAKLEGELKAEKMTVNETTKEKTFYKNKYLSIVTDQRDSTLQYSYNAEINIVKYDEKKSFLSKSKTYIDISSPDKNFKINGVENFKKEIYIKPRRFGLGLQAGYYYSPELDRFVPGVGIGVSYNLFKF